MWAKMGSYFRRYPARMSGYFSALVLWVQHLIPNFPLEIIPPSIMLMIGFAEYSQRAEDKKTIKALYADNYGHIPDEILIQDLCEKDSKYVKDECE